MMKVRLRRRRFNPEPLSPFALAEAAGSMTTLVQPCPWCGAAFLLRKGGRPQRFCSVSHRRQYHSAARQYVDRRDRRRPA